MKLTNENFKDELAMGDFSLVLISGNGCANCTIMFPIVNEVASKICNLEAYNIDIDETNNMINDYYEVDSVPTLLFLHRGELISKVKGYQPREILQIYIETKMEEFSDKQNLN